MDLWERARVFAEVAAKRSQEISKGAAKFSQDFVSETTKKSKEIAAEATKKADLIRAEALRAADQIKTLAVDLPTLPIPHLAPGGSATPDSASDLERFGITEELRDFIKRINLDTFRDFSMEDEPEMSDVPTVSNVRQDLDEWQARHAMLVLSTVKEISKLRFELCPRHMKERKFWRIYFVLVNNYVALYKKKYMEELKMKEEQKQKDSLKENTTAAPATKAEAKESKLPGKTSSSSNTEHDLDVFLLGDLGSDDDGPGDGDDGFDDEFDKIGSNSGLDSDDDEKKSKAGG